MKKLFSLFLCLILLLGLLPLAAPARAVSEGDWEYTVNGDYTTITKYTGTGGKVTIPSTLGGKPVKEIGGNAFQCCTGLTSVTIPASVTEIGDGAFYGCSGLARVTIPDSVTTIGYNAFSYCPTLRSVTIPASVASIGHSAFYGCTGLTSVTIPSGVTSIGARTFYGCTGLTSVTIPDSVTSIGSDAFCYCSGLTSVSIPGSVTEIGYCAFYGCTGLTSVTIPASVTSIGYDAFNGCTSLTSVTMGKGVTSIGGHAFDGCTGLTRVDISDLAAWCAIEFDGSGANPLEYAHVLYLKGKAVTKLTIPDGVKHISSNAFAGCSALCSVTIPDSVTSIGNDAFSGCSNLTRVDISDLAAWCAIEFGDGSIHAYESNPLYYAKHLWLNGSEVTDLTIPAGVKRIGNLTFHGYTGLTSMTISDSVTEIGDWAFDYCSGLTSVTIPNSVTEIGDCAFRGCRSLTSVTIPDSVTSIGSDAFCYCSGLTSVSIPGSVTEIGYCAFYGCTGLTSVTIPDSVIGIGECAFYGCTGLTTLTIPKNVKTVSDKAFYGCTGLTSLTIPKSVTTIGNSAFSSYSYPSKGLISAGPSGSGCDIRYGWTTSIPDNAFSSFSNLRAVVIPATVTEIQQDAFSGCSNLQQVYFGGTEVQWMELLILRGNDKLLSAELHCGYQTGDTIIVASGSCGDGLTWTLDQKGKLTVSGSGVTSGYAYDASLDRNLIRTAVLETGVTGIGNEAFCGCTALTSVTIPDSVISIGQYAFDGCTSLTSVTIPNSVISIGQYAFDSCTKINVASDNSVYCSVDGILCSEDGKTLIQFPARRTGSYTISSNVTTIQSGAFHGSSLTSVTIPHSVTSISDETFFGCTGLTSVTIPHSVTEIGYCAFYGCTGLTDVYYGGTEEDWGKIKITNGNNPLTTATIHYAGPLVISSVKANKTEANTCETITWTAAASGGSGSLKYYFILYKDGKKVTTRSYSTKNTFSYTPEEPGTYKVKVYVKDTEGTKVYKASKGVTVAAAAPAISSVKAGVTSATTGETITWTAKASGGTGTLKYYFILYKNGAKVKTQAYSTKNTFSYAPKGAGTFKVKVYVKDAEGTKVCKTSIDVTVTSSSAGPVISSVKAGVTSAYAGEKITWTATASGGSGTLQYFFFLYKDGVKIKNQAYSTKNTFSYTPTEAGSYKVKVYVKDSNEAKAYKTSGKIAVTLGPPAIISVKAGKTSANMGEKITWTAAAVGSEQPLQYYFILYKNGKKIKTRAYSTTNTFSYTPTEAGTYKVKVYVKDAEGTKVYKTSAKLTVTG